MFVNEHIFTIFLYPFYVLSKDNKWRATVCDLKPPTYPSKLYNNLDMNVHDKRTVRHKEL